MFWAVTPFFAPVHASIFLENLDRFASNLRKQGVPLLVVELAFGDAPFSVPQTCADRIVRLRSDAVLWHKERLINISHTKEGTAIWLLPTTVTFRVLCGSSQLT